MGISGEHFSFQLTPDRHDPINLTRSYPVQRRLLLRIPKVGISYCNGGGSRGMGDVRRRRPSDSRPSHGVQTLRILHFGEASPPSTPQFSLQLG